MRQLSLLLGLMLLAGSPASAVQDKDLERLERQKVADAQKQAAVAAARRAEMEAQVRDMQAEIARLTAELDRRVAAQAAAKERIEAEARRAKAVAEERGRFAELIKKEAQSARVRDQAEMLEQMDKLLQSVAANQGEKHAYAQRVRAELAREAAALTAQLAEARSRLGEKHPSVVALQHKLADLKKAAEARAKQGKVNTAVKRPGSSLTAFESQIQALERAQDALSKAPNSQAMKSYVDVLRQAQDEMQAKRNLIEKNHVDTLIQRRMDEMIEMKKRLADAEKLREKAVQFRGFTQVSGAGGGDRLERIEKKLDKIAGLLEQLIARDKK